MTGKISRNLVIAAAAIAACSASPASAAATIDCDNINNASSCTFGNSSPNSGQNIDFYTFSIGWSKVLTGTLYSFYTTIDQNVNFPQNGSYIAAGSPPALGATVAPFTVTQGQNPDIGSVGPVTLAAGTYTVRIRSFSGPNGQYSGTLSLGAVPEPATWAFMILGFGLVGGSLRHRKVAAKGRLALT